MIAQPSQLSYLDGVPYLFALVNDCIMYHVMKLDFCQINLRSHTHPEYPDFFSDVRHSELDLQVKVIDSFFSGTSTCTRHRGDHKYTYTVFEVSCESNSLVFSIDPTV